MNVLDMARQTIVNNGADGLCVDDCGCGVDDLAPCGHIGHDCELARGRTDKNGDTVYVPIGARGVGMNRAREKCGDYHRWNDTMRVCAMLNYCDWLGGWMWGVERMNEDAVAYGGPTTLQNAKRAACRAMRRLEDECL